MRASEAKVKKVTEAEAVSRFHEAITAAVPLPRQGRAYTGHPHFPPPGPASRMCWLAPDLGSRERQTPFSICHGGSGRHASPQGCAPWHL